MEDFVTWVDSSKIKQHVMNYNDEVSVAVRLTCKARSLFMTRPLLLLQRDDFDMFA